MHNIVSPPDRVAMLDFLGLEGKSCVEIGVLDGWFSSEILKRNPKQLILIDPWTNQSKDVYRGDHNNREEEDFDLMFSRVVEKFYGDERVKIIREFSYFAAPGVPNGCLDFVYIDAIHTLESCLTDIAVWFPKVKEGGWLCGHDYTGKYLGVRMAVESFCKISGQKLDLLTTEPWASWGIKKDTARRIVPSMGYKMPRNNRAVVTLAIGDAHQDLAKVTHPTMRLYAERIGADFVVITIPEKGKKHLSPHYEKFQLYSVLDQYDRVVYFDSDIIVRGDCPDLFEMVPRKKIGMYDEFAMGNEEEKQKHRSVMGNACSAYGIDCDDFFREFLFYNTGVMVLSKDHRDVFLPPEKEALDGQNYWEQPLINIRIKYNWHEVQDLGYKFNHMYYVEDKEGVDPRLDSYIIHYAGRGLAAKEMAEKDLTAWARSAQS